MPIEPGSPSPFHIRRAVSDDRERLIDIWWRSASATHRFLSRPQLEALLPEVRALQLETLDTWVLCTSPESAVGFLVMNGRAVEALFIAPEWLRRGGGSRLLRHARELAGPLTVEVNEQNTDAVAFYLAQRFEVVRRSPADSAGRPYPMLYLQESQVACTFWWAHGPAT
jgi:putative acetyltransferase